MKRILLFLILVIGGGVGLFILMPKHLGFLPNMVDPNPSEFLWVGKCGMLDRPVLLRYEGPNGDFPVESGALRKDFDREDCMECYSGDLALLRPFVQKNSKYDDLFIESEGEGRYKLRMILASNEPGEAEMQYQYKCGKKGVRPIWSSSEIFGVPVPEYGGKALSWSLGGWSVLVFLVMFALKRRKKRR